MDEKKLRAKLGDAKYEELVELLARLRAANKTNEEIIKELLTFLGEDLDGPKQHQAAP
jgi:hypothetical protein